MKDYTQLKEEMQYNINDLKERVYRANKIIYHGKFNKKDLEERVK